MALSRGNQFPQTVLDYAWRGSHVLLDTTSASVFEIQTFFHSTAKVERSIHAKPLECFDLYSTEKLITYTVQKILKARKPLPDAANLATLEKLVSTNILFDLVKKRSFVLSM